MREKSSGHFVLVLCPITKLRVMVLDMDTLEIRTVYLSDLDPDEPGPNPNGCSSGGGAALPMPKFTEEDVAELNKMIQNNRHPLKPDDVRYYTDAQRAALMKVLLMNQMLARYDTTVEKEKAGEAEPYVYG